MPVLHGKLRIKVIQASDLKKADTFGLSDPHCNVYLDKLKLGVTKTIKKTLNPVWDHNFETDVCGFYDNVIFSLRDEDVTQADFLGIVHLPVKKILENNNFEEEVDVLPREGKHDKGIKGKLKYSIHFQPIQPEGYGVADNPFPLRKNCGVHLYQGAHVGEDAPPSIFQEDQIVDYVPGNTWEDIYRSILYAKKFIYITGWSVNVNIHLLRRKPILREDLSHYEQDGGFMSIGDLLKLKSREGVKVLIHLWDEKLSTKVGPFNLKGLMNTHDEETKAFFQNTGVIVKLSYREGSKSSGFLWTHHQKSVILDEAIPDSDKFRVVAYVGGLDLCDGRWDTPKKSLFSTLFSEHKEDFHQVWPGISHKYGPRQPWQDIHSKIVGPVARDVMENFVQRWKKQAPSFVSHLYNLDETFLSPEDDIIEGEDAWSVELYRSIDSHSAPIEGVENGIERAYINAIRAAKKFIYIENQYFMGSSKSWITDARSFCNNQIPIEITVRICKAIAAGERFAAYIVIPMYPEGFPVDSTVQEILYWQWNTMEMMYSIIARAIKEAGIDAHPKDYLNFYCLANREIAKEELEIEITGDPKSEEHRIQQTLWKSRRFQIYVHSKMMIVDDEYVIVGSANINQRSLAGDRDTEIAIGGYQDKWLGSDKPRGDVHKFRMSLWSEHLHCSISDHLDPADLKTVHLINESAAKAWEEYASPEVQAMSSHLVRYPFDTDKNGKITANPKYFPDTKASVRGANSTILPDKLTC